MAKENENVKQGYQPLNEGYQPDFIKGYQPQATLSQLEGQNPPTSGSNIVPPSQTASESSSEK